MATVDGITAAKAQEIEDASVVSGAINIVNGHLILTTAGGVDIDAGQVADFGALATHEADLTTHGITAGAIAGTTQTQTLSNKTLTTPTISSFINAQHDHVADSGGGELGAVGRADSPAPVTSLTSVNLADGDPAKTLATITCPAGRWLLLASIEGVTLASATSTRFFFDLGASTPTLISKAVASSSDIGTINGGRAIWGWLENSATSVITFKANKNGSGALITTSTLGALVAIRMG